MSVERKVLYLKPGAKATAGLIEAVSERGREGDLKTVVVASTKGKTAIKLGEALKDVAEVIAPSSIEFDQLIWEGNWVHISYNPAPRGEILTARFGSEGTVYLPGIA